MVMVPDPIPPDPEARRAALMVRCARVPILIAMGMVTRINLSMYFCRPHIQPQENYKDDVPEKVLQRFADDPRVAELIGKEMAHGWMDEGPDMAKLYRGQRAGQNWHA
jgi:hypothetical protein